MKFFSKLNNLFLKGFVALSVTAPMHALATTQVTNKDLSDLTTGWRGTLDDIGGLAVAFFYLLALLILGAGILLMRKDQKQPNQDHAKHGMIAIIVAVSLAIITFILNVGANTVATESIQVQDYTNV